ncbi:RHS repeat-associated core domain-containing protein [Streptomyces rochei]|uniref:RHS repeat-associated core domain-containing protein n=2 Tax=Streptomyces rochei TaxID=1928 RepID=UPI003682F889
MVPAGIDNVPGGTTQAITIDDNGRPQAIKTTSGTTTLIDLTYSYAAAGKDTTKIRTRTDNLTQYKTTYTYDSQDRLSYALEADAAGTRKASWLYCFDKAGNLTSRDGSKNTCPGGTTYTYNDASELTGKNGSTTGWSYDKLGNETAAADNTPRTGESWTDYSQLAGITAGGNTYDLVHAGTSNYERTKLGSTWFHHTAFGLASTTTNGVDTGFIREPAGTLNSMTTGGKSYYYLTDATGNVLGLVDDTGKRTHTYAYGPTGLPRTTPTEAVPQPYRYVGAYADPTGLYKMGHRYYDPALGRFTQPDPSGLETNPYLYAEGDPINLVDPSGTDACDNKVVGLIAGPALCGSKETRKTIQKVAGGVAAAGAVCTAVTLGGCAPAAGGATAAATVVGWVTTLRD